MLLRLYNEDTPLMDHSKDRFLKNPNTAAEPVSDAEMEEAAEKEAEEKLAVAAARDDTNLLSDDDDDDDEEEGGVSIRTAGMAAEATGLGSGEGSGAMKEQYGSSTGVDNVRE
jgi:hypothetical protein